MDRTGADCGHGDIGAPDAAEVTAITSLAERLLAGGLSAAAAKVAALLGASGTARFLTLLSIVAMAGARQPTLPRRMMWPRTNWRSLRSDAKRA